MVTPASPSQPALSDRYYSIVGGERVEPTSASDDLLVEDPSTEDVVSQAQRIRREDVTRAIDVAEDAFLNGPWGRMSDTERSTRLTDVAELIADHREELIGLTMLDIGKPYAEAAVEVESAVSTFRAFAEAMPHSHGASLLREGSNVPSGILNYVTREPVGVVGLITPFNVPLMHAARKLAGALAAGNTTVLKPPEQAMLSTIRLVELMTDARAFPPGVVNMVLGDGVAGAALVADRRVGAISFTGSDVTGKTIMRDSADRLRKLSFELGGKAPFIVFEDVDDLGAVAHAAARACYGLAGQGCLNGARVLVEASVYEPFIAELVRVTREWRVGPPSMAEAQMGPLISAKQLERVAGYVRLGEEEGAERLCGGDRPSHLEKGHFMSPALLTNVAPESRLYQEEIFGPVLIATSFKDDDDAVMLANDTSYGLNAYVWTERLDRAHSVSKRLRCGTVWVNTLAHRDIDVPFGGYGRSGLGRQSTGDFLDFFSESKVVCVRF